MAYNSNDFSKPGIADRFQIASSMTKRIRLLLIISLALLLAAFSVKRIHLSEKASMIVGLVEVLSAIVLGIAFGLAGRAEEK